MHLNSIIGTITSYKESSNVMHIILQNKHGNNYQGQVLPQNSKFKAILNETIYFKYIWALSIVRQWATTTNNDTYQPRMDIVFMKIVHKYKHVLLTWIPSYALY